MRFRGYRIRALVRHAAGRLGSPAALLSALVLGVSAGSANAQQATMTPVTTMAVDDGASPSVAIQRRSGFNLFAEEDLATSGMSMTGGFGWHTPNVGPCPWYFTFNLEVCGFTQNQAGNFAQPYFEITWIAGAPISEFRKIRNVHPGVSNMRPPLGYTAPYTFYLATPQARRWGPGDGQFGNLFSGATATSDGSCRDDQTLLDGRVPVGFTLLASSDCPPTWPSAGFLGKRPVLTEGWLAAFQADPAGFQFNDWTLPPSAYDTTQFLGNFSTYGLTSDSYREIIQRFGSVTRLGSGAPAERGYPLGLDMRFDAFQFSRPSLRNAVFYSLTIVNNSERLYGTGIDYDSLYFGMAPGILIGGQAQGTSWYPDFQRGTIVFARGNTSGNCSATFPRRTPVTGGCVTTDGQTNVMMGISVLKSPIGDLRNKEFSDPASAFYNPTSQFADDTITFQHMRRAGFGFLYNSTFARNDKALFGYMASMEDVFLDGRSPTDFTPLQLFQFFQNENFQGVIDPNIAQFNNFVPGETPGYGSWDYNNDGVQDTIHVPQCGQAGCAAVFSDSIAGGLQNFVSNVGNLFSTGPFPLAAGDTTQFLYVFMGTADSTSMEALINSVVRAYMTDYAGPAAVPPPTFAEDDIEVTPAEVRDSTLAVQTAQIRVRIEEPAPYLDAFVANVLDILGDPSNTTAQRLVALNPNLIADVQARLPRNYAQLLVFKSCDGGATFTVTNDCRPARATNPDGTAIGFGWQPYQVIPVDTTTGRLTQTFFTDVVMAGRTYSYTFVTNTRGLIDIPIVDSIGGRLMPTNLANALNIDADTISSPLFRSGPSVATVYAPVTLPAGRQLAELDFEILSGGSTRTITTTPRGNLVAGDYRLFFANRFIVTTQEDTVSGEFTQTIEAQRVLARGGTTTDPNAGTDDFVAQSVTFTGTGLVQGVTLPVNAVDTTGTVITYVDTIATSAGGGYLLAGGPGGATQPFFLSTTLTTVPGLAFEQFAGFPGFLFSFPSELVPRFNGVLRAPGDTLNQGVVNANGVTYQAAPSNYAGPGGIYQLEWEGDAFGPLSPFTFGTVDELQSTFTQSLTSRPVAQTGDISTEVEALLPASTRPLVAVKLPFSVTGPLGDDAIVAMRQRHTGSADSIVKNSILLGTAGDTTRLSVPPDIWVPGDTLFVLAATLRDSTVGSGATLTTVVRDTVIAGRNAQAPIQVRDTILHFPRFVLGCNSNSVPSRLTCNPIRLGTRAATGYLPYQAGFTSVVDVARNFNLFSEVQLNASALGLPDRPLTGAERDRVHVVPNPYIVQSQFDQVDAARVGTPRLLFVNVPQAGTMRIYTVSGQFVQQLTWTAADLEATGSGQPTGDLPYNLRTREGLDLGTGLYLYVINPAGNGGSPIRGKFVIIR
jgi:hypothetical protein